MPNEVIYYCVNGACERSFPRLVAFCPYCGTGQLAGAVLPAALAHAQEPVPEPAPSVTPEPFAASVTAALAASRLDTTPLDQPLNQPLNQPPSQPLNQPLNRPLDAPIHQPIGKRYWLLALLALWGIWHLTKPDGEAKLNARVGAAVALAAECGIDAARAELKALKSARAAPEQLRRLQTALRDSAAACEKKRGRAKAWSDINAGLEGVVGAGAFAKAASRLSGFVRHWGEDAETRALASKLEQKQAEAWLDAADVCLAKRDRLCAEQRLTAVERSQRPELSQRAGVLRQELARLTESQIGQSPAAESAPAPALQGSGRTRGMIAQAERDLAQGNYKRAATQLEWCARMADRESQECRQLKKKAERLDRAMTRCVAAGNDWTEDRCQ